VRGERWRRGRVGLLSLLIAAVVLVALAGGVTWFLTIPVGAGEPRLVMIEAGESVLDVVYSLENEGLIRSPAAFMGAAYVTGKWRLIQAGRHELDPGMTSLEMLDALCRGSHRKWQWVTIPEGYTLRQTAAVVEEAGLGTASELMRVAEQPGVFETGFPLPEDSLEGYLFPDTYRVDSGENEQEILVQMLRRFEQVVWEGLFAESPEYDGRSLREIIILASLVEAEAKRDEERPVIAGVFMNRLRQGRRLECDATVQYALGEARKKRLNYEDLLIDSEYNTYTHGELPPGPICNPGEASIEAAMHPAEVPHLYYVARADGSHIFSNTFAQHTAAIARVRRESNGAGQ
jgi:UPF0755 protein